MFNLSLPWWEFVLRGVAVYVFLIIALRLAGKRQIGQMAPSDLVLLLILANALQNSMNGGDNSLIGGLLIATSLILINSAVAWAAWRHRPFERVIEGQPEVLIHNGRVFKPTMARARMTRHDLAKVLRRAGAEQLADVHYAILENDGGISIKLNERPRPSAQEAPEAPTPESRLWRSVQADGDEPGVRLQP